MWVAALARVVAVHALLAAPSADPDALELQWEAPPQCPAEAEVRAQTMVLVEPDRPLQSISATAVVDNLGGEWIVHLEVDGQSSSLTSANCGDLARATALILSLALSPEVADPAPQQPDEPASMEQAPSHPPREPANRPPKQQPAVAVEKRSAGLRGAVRVDGAIRYGIVPTLSDASLAAALLWPRARIEVAGLFASPASGPSGSVVAGTVSGRGCGVLSSERFEFPLCGGLAMGTVRVVDEGVDPRVVQHGLLVGGTLDAAWVVPFRRNLSLWVGPGVTVSLRRPRFLLGRDGRSYVVGAVAIRGALGIELRFP